MNPRTPLFLWALALAGCAGGDPNTATAGPDGRAADWALVDVNPDSATYEQTRGPSDYAGSVSGWYFAHAT
ncbi:hypothetical protein SAMN02745121_05367 [Nannocystis exedens]|uniref:Uncharacterized protein n=1 Tax=Nannocystis exedens TaxID=54 RepID=A0A1I2D002_9BACT|nr:hypothetical protein [Nannocystis exedens]PCC68691.1 hypothetical protein NAEX_01708 [Nannocystis exedens]SFE73866.1 hypothetical protein SAMN02745121_05367 [Nannocystis exedens]